MPFQYDRTAVLELAKCSSYREFLIKALEHRVRLNAPLSYARLATLAGFSARSFPRDVILGKKRLTLSSASRFGEALGLKNPLANHFKLLVQREEIGSRSTAVIERALQASLGRM